MNIKNEKGKKIFDKFYRFSGTHFTSNIGKKFQHGNSSKKPAFQVLAVYRSFSFLLRKEISILTSNWTASNGQVLGVIYNEALLTRKAIKRCKMKMSIKCEENNWLYSPATTSSHEIKKSWEALRIFLKGVPESIAFAFRREEKKVSRRKK